MDKNENEDGAHRLLLPRTRPPRLVTTTSLLAAVVVVVLLIGGGLQQRRQRTPKQQPPQHPVVVLCKVVISCLCWLGSNLRLRWKLMVVYSSRQESSCDCRPDVDLELSGVDPGSSLYGRLCRTRIVRVVVVLLFVETELPSFFNPTAMSLLGDNCRDHSTSTTGLDDQRGTGGVSVGTHDSGVDKGDDDTRKH